MIKVISFEFLKKLQGPIGVRTSCYCAPFFQKVEHKLESDKNALMHHIDVHHEKLDKRIHSLERKTHCHITNLKETVKEKVSAQFIVRITVSSGIPSSIVSNDIQCHCLFNIVHRIAVTTFFFLNDTGTWELL
mgnify:CR=1 FL=1